MPSTLIPEDVRQSILLTDDELAAELAHMTDAHTDQLAASAAAATEDGVVPGPPWQFVNGCSRLVVDPERFPDEREEMLSVGMGAVYTQTSHRQALRGPDPHRDAALVQRYYDPYARAFAELVDDRLALTGSAVIIDLHSYPASALPYELHADLPRPAICLGTDESHTPAEPGHSGRGGLRRARRGRPTTNRSSAPTCRCATFAWNPGSGRS